ncbi:hypothetical protein Leucomu_10660 [Leucobacter muris]|uniref:MFS transporter n=1 Tax=Leucobacter muris TaxID=1935379 RepID=A0ABX5QH67_9MICO|nr:hypothetical protein [Leucobacter muris]QAB18316.1 hypothetical protein Leucomu_10660 [Leucobacter muris]
MFDRADQVPTFLYSAIYLTLIGGICLYLGAKVWTSGSRSYSALIIGAGIVAVGCFFQFGALGSIAFSWLPTETSDALYAIGLAGLTGGVVCMAANVAAVAFRRVRSTRQVARSIASMEELMHRKGLLADVRATPAENDLARLYEEVIAVNDHIHTEGNALSDEEMKQVSAASDLVARKMFEDAPRPVRYPRPLRAIVNWAVKGKASQPAAADHSNTALIPTAEPAMTSRESA